MAEPNKKQARPDLLHLVVSRLPLRKLKPIQTVAALFGTYAVALASALLVFGGLDATQRLATVLATLIFMLGIFGALTAIEITTARRSVRRPDLDRRRVEHMPLREEATAAMDRSA